MFRTEKDREAYIEKQKESISTLEGVLHRTPAPNLKALEKMREVRDKLHGLTEGTSLNVFLVVGFIF